MKLLLTFYNIILLIITPFLAIVLYPILKHKGKAAFYWERFGFIKVNSEVKSDNRSAVWFHAASVGEVRSIKPITEMLKAKNIKIVITTMTATGRKEALNYIGADFACLIPLENGKAIMQLMKELGVRMTVIVDTELWPNLIYVASSHSSLILINARISDRTFKSYKRFSLIFSPLLQRFSAICAKSNEDASRFQAIAPKHNNIVALGNIKFQARKKVEDVIEKADKKDLSLFQGFDYFLLASTHEGEEEIILDYILEDFKFKKLPFSKLIIAPRHIERSNSIKAMVEGKGLESSIYSEGSFDKEVLIVDRFGILELLYINAKKIFIGGSLVNIGGHNIYEALQFRKKVAVGGYMHAFKDIYEEASQLGLVATISDRDSLYSYLLKDDDRDDKVFDELFTLVDSKNNEIIKILFDIISQAILK